jgi:hypothetical protein
VKGLKALQKPLAGAHGSEPSCASEAITGGDVTALDGLGGVAAAAMQPRAHMAGERNDRGDSFYIRLVMVSDDCCGLYLRSGQGLTKKRFRTGPITLIAQKHINDLPVFINCTI